MTNPHVSKTCMSIFLKVFLFVGKIRALFVDDRSVCAVILYTGINKHHYYGLNRLSGRQSYLVLGSLLGVRVSVRFLIYFQSE